MITKETVTTYTVSFTPEEMLGLAMLLNCGVQWETLNELNIKGVALEIIEQFDGKETSPSFDQQAVISANRRGQTGYVV